MNIADLVPERNRVITIQKELRLGRICSNIINGKTTVNYAAYECADGKWLSVAAMEIKFWNNLCEAIGQVQWKRKNQTELLVSVFPKSEVESFFKSKTRAEWMALFPGKDVCVAPILELEDLEDAH